ncbi:MAG: DUF4276 family protein [Chloroflexota bacterium]
MTQVFISVEGQTEETFVREVLASHLEHYGIYTTAIILTTSRTIAGIKRKGGIIPYFKAQHEITNLLRNTKIDAVTTMYDLYKLQTDFPGYATVPAGNCFTKTAYLEAEFKKAIDNPRFRPYLQVHEFEAFLFVDPTITAGLFPGTNNLKELLAIKQKFNSSEEINDGETTAPSKRILHLFPNYQKVTDGSLVVKNVGLEKIRAECRHFDEWLTWLEQLG